MNTFLAQAQEETESVRRIAGAQVDAATAVSVACRGVSQGSDVHSWAMLVYSDASVCASLTGVEGGER